MRYKDKVALILGGNSGIGLATAKIVAKEGGTVYITGRDEKTLREAEVKIPGLKAYKADMADTGSLKSVLAEIKAAHGRIDALFVNAGIGAFAPVAEVTPEVWDQVHGVNLRGAFFATQAALPLMGKGSAIVFTGSIGSLLAIPGNVMYASAKAGLRAAARIIGKEVITEGIRVNMVSPGPTETPIINRNIDMDPAEVEGLRQMMIASVPMKRMGEAKEIAKAAVFLGSDDASFIAGVDLYVDGGCVEL